MRLGLGPTNEMAQECPTRHSVQPDSLLWFWGNVYSQRGQDGILREIFCRLGIRCGMFVEFGAWDGMYLSNCRFLFEKGWHGVFIEADPDRFRVLTARYAKDHGIVCLNETVSAEKPLNKLLRNHTQHTTTDFVSIDIDGLDLDVALASHLPQIGAKVVLIEGGFNFDPHLEKRIPTEVAAENIGQPIAVMVREMGQIGYEPVCFFQDVYFVRRELVEKFPALRRDPVSLYQDAFNFMGDEHKTSLIEFRSKIGAEDFERPIRFLETIPESVVTGGGGKGAGSSGR